MQDLADDANALVRSLGLSRYVLIGHSMGGKAARMTTIPQTGHLSPLEVPDKIAGEIRAFLRG